MVDTDPVNIALTVDPTDLTAGLNEGSRAMSDFGSSADGMAQHVEGASRASRTLFRGLVEMRVALMSTEHVLKLFGIQNETVSKIMNSLNVIMDVAITVMAIYRAASFLAANADLARAGAAFLAAVAELSAATLFVGTAVGIAATFGAYEAYRVWSGQGLGLPGMAQGGIVLPRSGGTIVRLGEGGYAEAVVPLKSGTTYGDTHVTMNVYSNDPDYISRQLARLIEQRKMAGFS